MCFDASSYFNKNHKLSMTFDSILNECNSLDDDSSYNLSINKYNIFESATCCKIMEYKFFIFKYGDLLLVFYFSSFNTI